MEETTYIEEYRGYCIWKTEGDNLPYWISDTDGYELCSYESYLEARNDTDKIIEEEKGGTEW